MARACMNSADLPAAAGLPRPTVQNAIVGKGIRPSTLGRIARALGVDPADIFKKYGADMIRLWAGSADYHVDVRCSDNIFKQLSQNYLKFRNTARYCLGNLDGFDPNNLVKPEEMVELDRWAVTKLNALIEKCFAAYDNYEFHVVSHAVNDFCVVELSSFYLDIIKDRLYCGDGAGRASAQSALLVIGGFPEDGGSRNHLQGVQRAHPVGFSSHEVSHCLTFSGRIKGISKAAHFLF